MLPDRACAPIARALSPQALAEGSPPCGGLLDVRPPPVDDHLLGSAWLPVGDPQHPEPALPVHMLPPRGEALTVVAATSAAARAVAAHLCARGWPAAYLDAAPPPDLLRPGAPRGALWRADAYVQRQLHRLPRPGGGTILDIAGGNGRNAVYLAQQGHRVVVVDRLPDALRLCRDRARRHGVAVETRVADLRHLDALPQGPFAVALMIRYFRGALAADLQARLPAGGLLILRTFAVGAPRGRRYQLAPRQLSSWFPEAAWERVDGPRVGRDGDVPLLEAMLRRR